MYVRVHIRSYVPISSYFSGSRQPHHWPRAWARQNASIALMSVINCSWSSLGFFSIHTYMHHCMHEWPKLCTCGFSLECSANRSITISRNGSTVCRNPASKSMTSQGSSSPSLPDMFELIALVLYVFVWVWSRQFLDLAYTCRNATVSHQTYAQSLTVVCLTLTQLRNYTAIYRLLLCRSCLSFHSWPDTHLVPWAVSASYNPETTAAGQSVIHNKLMFLQPLSTHG